LEKFVDSTAELFLPVRGWSAKIFFVGEHLIHRKWTLPISALMKARSALVVERLGGYLEPGQLEASPIQNLPGSFFWASPCICHVDFSWHVDAMGRRIGFAPSNCLAFTHSLDQTLAKLAHL